MNFKLYFSFLTNIYKKYIFCKFPTHCRIKKVNKKNDYLFNLRYMLSELDR